MKLTRRERHEIYLQLQGGRPTGDFAGVMPFERLTRIWNEFHPQPPKPKPDGQPRGVMGNRRYCENGCGTVLAEKKDSEVFIRGFEKRGSRLVCPACFKLLNPEPAP